MATEEIARFYTRSRRFPKMIGRMTDGSRIPGGPYTLTQVGFGGVALMGLLVTRTAWTTNSVLFDMAITVGAAWGVTWLVGLIPMTRRNLVAAFMDAAAAMFKPRGGRYKGQSIRLVRPHQAIGKALRAAPARPSLAEAEAKAVPAERETLAPASTASTRTPSPRAITGVERLLQQSKNISN